MTVDQDIINNGMLGFMAYISNSSDFTAQQKANASAASSMLTGAPNKDERYDKASWYDSYVDQDMSRETNPLSLEQLRNALTYLDTQNNIRKANGQSELSVSLRMTAAAALNASYSSNIWGHSDHYFDNAENLAGGGGVYMGGETVDTLGWPYTGLYTEEKELFDQEAATNSDLAAHRYDSYYIYWNYYNVYSKCGHYLNIIDAGNEAIGIATGSGKNTDSEVTIFDYSGSASQKDFTVSEFKKLVNDYIDSAYSAGGTQAQKQQLKELQSKLTEAQKKFGTASTAYNAALNKQFDAQEAFKAAGTSMNTAKGEYESAQAATATAKGAYDAAKSELDASGIDIDALQQNLNTAKGEATAAQTALDEANSKLADCQTNASKASTRKLNAQSGYDAAKTKSDKAKEAYDEATASVKDLTAKCDAAQRDLTNKQDAFSKAEAADKAAQAGVNDAEAVATAAATALSNAQQAVTNKEQVLAAAQQEVTSAQTALDAANAAFQRYADAQKALDDAEAAHKAAVASVNAAQEQLDAANQAVVNAEQAIADAKAELARDKALQADLEHVDPGASLAAGVTVFNAGWTAQNQLPKLDAAYARYKAAVDAEKGLRQAEADADAKLSDANDAYAAALAELNDAKDALAAAQAEYDKYHPKAEPQAKPQVAQAAAKAPAAKKQAADGALAQTGDTSALAGEVFVIGGVTLVAAGVTLSDRRRKQM